MWKKSWARKATGNAALAGAAVVAMLAIGAVPVSAITLVSHSCIRSLEELGPCTLTFQVAAGVLADKQTSTPPVQYLKIKMQEVLISS